MRANRSKPRLVNWPRVGLLLVYLTIASGLIVAAMVFAHHNSNQRPISPPNARLATNDALTQELIRCQSLGELAAKDRACLSAWAESRRRFFGTSSEQVAHP
jgi:conjugative transfer region protein TrbK